MLVEFCGGHGCFPPLAIPSQPYRVVVGGLLMAYGAMIFSGLLGGIFSASHGAILSEMAKKISCKTLPWCTDHFYALFKPQSVFSRNEDLGRKFVDVRHQEDEVFKTNESKARAIT